MLKLFYWKKNLGNLTERGQIFSMKRIKARLSSVYAKPAIAALCLNLIYYNLFIITPVWIMERENELGSVLILSALFIILIGFPIAAGVCGFVLQIRYRQKHKVLISAGIFTAISLFFYIVFFGLFTGSITSPNLLDEIFEFAAKQAIPYIAGGGIIKLPYTLFKKIQSPQKLHQSVSGEYVGK